MRTQQIDQASDQNNGNGADKKLSVKRNSKKISKSNTSIQAKQCAQNPSTKRQSSRPSIEKQTNQSQVSVSSRPQAKTQSTGVKTTRGETRRSKSRESARIAMTKPVQITPSQKSQALSVPKNSKSTKIQKALKTKQKLVDDNGPSSQVTVGRKQALHSQPKIASKLRAQQTEDGPAQQMASTSRRSRYVKKYCKPDESPEDDGSDSLVQSRQECDNLMRNPYFKKTRGVLADGNNISQEFKDSRNQVKLVQSHTTSMTQLNKNDNEEFALPSSNRKIIPTNSSGGKLVSLGNIGQHFSSLNSITQFFGCGKKGSTGISTNNGARLASGIPQSIYTSMSSSKRNFNNPFTSNFGTSSGQTGMIVNTSMIPQRCKQTNPPSSVLASLHEDSHQINTFSIPHLRYDQSRILNNIMHKFPKINNTREYLQMHEIEDFNREVKNLELTLLKHCYCSTNILSKILFIKMNQIQYNCIKSKVEEHDQLSSNMQKIQDVLEQDREVMQDKITIRRFNQLNNLKDQLTDEFSQRYVLINEVGKGAFGSVYRAIDSKQQRILWKLMGGDVQNQQIVHHNYIMKHPFFAEQSNFVAIKRLFYDRRYEQRELSTLNEIKRNNLCQNIIELREKYFRKIDEPIGPDSNQTAKREYLYIVTDFLPYTINDLNVNPLLYGLTEQTHINDEDNLCLESIKQVMHGVFLGLKDLHSLGITHRDIKLSNILIDNNQYPVTKVKICDLGSSKKLRSDPNDESTASICYIGTRSFKAPELLAGNKFYDEKIDIWSAGIVFVKLICKYINKKVYLFDVRNTEALSKVVMDFVGEPTSQELKEMNSANNLMTKGVKSGFSDAQIESKRFRKFDQLLKNQISPECLDILHRIFQLSPLRRISAQQALDHPYFKVGKLSVQTKQSAGNTRTTDTTSPSPMIYR